MQVILATSNKHLFLLTLVADKIAEIAHSSSIASVTNCNINRDSSKTIAGLAR